MNRNKWIGIAAGAVVMVSAVCITAAALASYPAPNLPTAPGGQAVRYEFADSAVFPNMASAPLYRMQVGSPEELRGQVSEALGAEVLPIQRRGGAAGEAFYLLEERDMTVTINEKTGDWAFLKNGTDGAGLTPPENLPSDEEAAAIAKTYIVEHGLFEGDLGEPGTAASTTGSGSEEQPLARRVVFQPRVEDVPVYGLYRIVVTVGENGAVTEVSKQAAPAEKAAEVSLRSQESVVKEVLEHSQKLSSSAPQDMSLGSITEWALAYYADGRSPYLHPIYILSGTGEVPGGGTEVFDIIVDAVER